VFAEQNEHAYVLVFIRQENKSLVFRMMLDDSCSFKNHESTLHMESFSRVLLPKIAFEEHMSASGQDTNALYRMK
jgi:hypothetical protein